ncbi:hypothetical protein [Anaerovibrio sp.]|uniref:hypothetical protein n=1 Tax=Anaerovibrio sp. TaxID=1872532 RepID=UPI0038905A1D
MRGWQANKKAHLWAANRKGLCPKLKNHRLGGWLFIELRVWADDGKNDIYDFLIMRYNDSHETR